MMQTLRRAIGINLRSFVSLAGTIDVKPHHITTAEQLVIDLHRCVERHREIKAMKSVPWGEFTRNATVSEHIVGAVVLGVGVPVQYQVHMNNFTGKVLGVHDERIDYRKPDLVLFDIIRGVVTENNLCIEVSLASWGDRSSSARRLLNRAGLVYICRDSKDTTWQVRYRVPRGRTFTEIAMGQFFAHLHMHQDRVTRVEHSS